MAGGKYFSMRAASAPAKKSRSKRPDKKLATIATVKRLINYNVDKWRVDSQVINAVDITSTATVTHLSNIGDDDYALDHFEFRGLITNATLTCLARLIFFQWKDDSAPVVADLLSFTTSPLSPIGISSDVGYTCAGRMHLLADMLIPLNTNTKNVYSFTKKFYKKKLLDIKSDTTDTRNKIYVCFLSNTAVTAPVLTLTRSIIYHKN